MRKYWMLALPLLLVAIGCEQQAAQRELEVAKKIQTNSATEPATLDRGGETNPVAKPKNASDTKVDANVVLEEAIAQAKADNRALFVKFSADW